MTPTWAPVSFDSIAALNTLASGPAEDAIVWKDFGGLMHLISFEIRVQAL